MMKRKAGFPSNATRAT